MTEKKTAADALLESRRAVYGDRPDQMRRTAQIWSGLTGFDIQPWMVPMLMSAYKMLRAFNAPDYSDNVDDVDGWMVMFREQMEADGQPIINARTVEEYLHKKFGPRLDSTEGLAIDAHRERWADSGVAGDPDEAA